MKTKLLLLLSILLTITKGFAQAPQAIPYQAVARDAAGTVLTNRTLGIRFQLHDVSATGTVVYSESQTIVTNSVGTFTANIGQGTVLSGSIANINWGAPKFIQVEMDLAGGTAYVDMGTKQMLSVPYAQYANNGQPSGTALGQMLYWNGSSWVSVSPGSSGQSLVMCDGVPTWGGCLPQVNITGITTSYTTATINAIATASDNAAVATRGVCWSTAENPIASLSTRTNDGNGGGNYTSNITGLTPNTTYHVRAYAVNSSGTAYSTDLVFTTKTPGLPTVITAPINSVSKLTTASGASTNAKGGGNVTDDGGSTVTSRGVCWGISPNPTRVNISNYQPGGSGTGSFTNSFYITQSSTPPSTYYVRAYATNASGTAYGENVAFSNVNSTVPSYVTIGDQQWSASNLNVATYRNGDPIPQITVQNQWDYLTTGAWCYYNNDPANGSTYGKLYNWYAVNDPRGLAPAGWHVPTIAEWKKLVKYLDNAEADTFCTDLDFHDCVIGGYAGGSMKSTTSVWPSPNTGATNSSGFSGLPGGYLANSNFSDRNAGFWWSTNQSQSNNTMAYKLSLSYDNSAVIVSGGPKYSGFSVRIVKDPELPAISTNAISAIASESAACGGNITFGGGADITARGVCWSTSPNPTVSLSTKTTDGTGSGSYSSKITGLTANTTYYVRAYATNSAGTSYGSQQSFTTTTFSLPIVSNLGTYLIKSITASGATGKAVILSDGGTPVIARGICWSSFPNPTVSLTTKTVDGTGTGQFTSNISGLIQNNTYYVRAYVTNQVGTQYGPQETLIKTSIGGFVDLPSTVIGNQVWTTQNLDVAFYQNGDPLSREFYTMSSQYIGATVIPSTVGSCSWYADDSASFAKYGRLYNRYAVTDPRGLAPAGWHIAKNTDWNKLIKFLDQGADTTVDIFSATGGLLKSTMNWESPNTGATNSTGFSALPGGYLRDSPRGPGLYDTPQFVSLGFVGAWWSVDSPTNTPMKIYELFNTDNKIVSDIIISEDIIGLFSVRLVRD